MTDDAALVAELRRLNGGLDAEWGDDEAFDTLKTKLWLHRTRLLDLAEEAIRLRASQMSPFGEAALKLYDENEALRGEVEAIGNEMFRNGKAAAYAEMTPEVEKLRAVVHAVISVADSGLLPDGDGVNTPTLMWLESVRAAIDAAEGCVDREPDTTTPAPDVHSIGYPETVENIYDDAALNMARHQGRIDGWRVGCAQTEKILRAQYRRALDTAPDVQAQDIEAPGAQMMPRTIQEVEDLIDAAVEKARATWMEPCDICCGTGKVLGAPCACGGSGKLADALKHARLCLIDVDKQIDAAVAACEQRCAAQLADYASRAADDARAAVARERGRVIGIFVGELQKLHEKTVLDCGDNSCLFATRRGGMRTNGGCRCIERLLDAAVAREREAAVYDFAAWLTTRKERLVLSSSDDAAPAAKAVQAYLRARSAKGV